MSTIWVISLKAGPFTQVYIYLEFLRSDCSKMTVTLERPHKLWGSSTVILLFSQRSKCCKQRRKMTKTSGGGIDQLAAVEGVNWLSDPETLSR